MTKENENAVSVAEIRTFQKANYALLLEVRDDQKNFAIQLNAQDARVTALEAQRDVFRAHVKFLWTLCLIIFTAFISAFFTDFFGKINKSTYNAQKVYNIHNGKTYRPTGVNPKN